MRRAPARVVDLLVAGAVAFPTLMDAWWNEAGTRQADGITYALAAISIGAVALRRRWPFVAAVVCGGALTGWYLLGHQGELLILPTMVTLYTIAVHTDRRESVLTGVVAASWSGLLGITSSNPFGARGGSPVLELLWPLIPLAFGDATRSRQELVAHAEADRQREARRQVEAERVHIAREFHDVVAHTMSAVHVQIGVAVAAFESKPAAARAALLQARASTKDALRELRATVALLRTAVGDPTTAPAPRLDQIEELADTLRAAGIVVAVDGHTDHELPASVELAAYRIVQEALTNVVRHSDARNVAVSLRRAPPGLVVEVTDDGTTSPAGVTASPAARRGFGHLGMAERAAALGGSLEHGPSRDGGFRVHAVLPLSTPS